MAISQKAGCATKPLFGQHLTEGNSYLLFEQMQEMEVSEFELLRQAMDSARLTGLDDLQHLPHSLVKAGGHTRVSFDGAAVLGRGPLPQASMLGSVRAKILLRRGVLRFVP